MCAVPSTVSFAAHVGLPDIDFDDLKLHTTYSGYRASDETIRSFWKVLEALTKEEKALFVQFVTGSSKVPLGGFSALQVR